MIIDKQLRKRRYEYDELIPSGGKAVNKNEGEIYAGKVIIPDNEVSGVIKSLLQSDGSKMIARFGANELKAMISGLCDDYPCHLWERHKRNVEHDGLFSGAGVFPRNVNLIPSFAQIMKDACKEVDLLGVWFNRYEDMVIQELCDSEIKLCSLKMLAPQYDPKHPWTECLTGRKVLVVHPFVDSMRKQYEKRDLLFENKNMLPDMDLHFLKAVQSSAGQKNPMFKNWFDALEYMYEETQKFDYEIAIIGCGAYGFPLASMMKRDGKKVLHLGGTTQLLFGIIGQRWLDNPNEKIKINDAWIHPSMEETPRNFHKVEGGCYW